MPIAQNPPPENFYLSPLITFSVYSANSVVNRFLFILFTTEVKGRCALKEEIKKPNIIM
ncbi:hypothetical protein P20439_1145 [Pseudoalteromonas sp. BSi20439]|nr:hypothetical protein P20439_1145 [Pseudoalteromonas sp. BSi20439]